MFGYNLILMLAIVGGIIAFIGDKLGSKIGKKRLSVFGLRPYHTSVLITVVTGILIATVSLGILAISSNDARTALFGMQKLQTELATLNRDKEAATLELAANNQLIAELGNKIKLSSESLDAMKEQRDEMNEQLVALQERYTQAGADLAATKAEVDTLLASRGKLEQEIGELEAATEKLQAGLVAVREGQVVFRAGEVLFAGDLQTGLKATENKKQLDLFLAAANEKVLRRMGVADDTVWGLWLPQKLVEQALQVLAEPKGKVYVRVRTAGNIIAGEMAVSTLEIMPNRVVYPRDAKIYSKVVTIEAGSENVQRELFSLLTEVNKLAVTAGVLPDPLTGKVGTMDAATMMEASDKMNALGGEVELTAYARNDITIAGPVLLRLEVERP
ncbi:MAG: DUF3084 domain-containing protein [Acidaminococcaceae bacterium]